MYREDCECMVCIGGSHCSETHETQGHASKRPPGVPDGLCPSGFWIRYSVSPTWASASTSTERREESLHLGALGLELGKLLAGTLKKPPLGGFHEWLIALVLFI